ncbi:MAG: hypothetical protein WCD34_15890 [Candidatus Acidiferrum sp.]
MKQVMVIVLLPVIGFASPSPPPSMSAALRAAISEVNERRLICSA